MIINAVKAIRTSDVPTYAWSRIAQFQNTDYTASVIAQLHQLQKNQSQNAKRQAEQVKYCLSQAREYFDAARIVSLATRPVLLYYSAMSMALAEILLKQTGDSRLSILRERHNCHGLQFVMKTTPKPEDALKEAASCLIAKAQIDAVGCQKGTFEVWRRSAREYPACGDKTVRFANGATQTGYAVLLVAADTPPPVLPKSGITLLECLSQLPYMGDVLARWGTGLEMVRATIRSEQNGVTDNPTITAILHPTSAALLDKFGELVVVEPEAVNSLEIFELPSSYIIRQRIDPNLGRILRWPHSICLTNEDIYFSCTDINLAEFGFLYVALHICGTFARYYPDLWLKHIERSSPLAMAVDDLCTHAFDRLPLLVLSELLRCYHVVEV